MIISFAYIKILCELIFKSSFKRSAFTVGFYIQDLEKCVVLISLVIFWNCKNPKYRNLFASWKIKKVLEIICFLKYNKKENRLTSIKHHIYSIVKMLLGTLFKVWQFFKCASAKDYVSAFAFHFKHTSFCIRPVW